VTVRSRRTSNDKEYESLHEVTETGCVFQNGRSGHGAGDVLSSEAAGLRNGPSVYDGLEHRAEYKPKLPRDGHEFAGVVVQAGLSEELKSETVTAMPFSIVKTATFVGTKETS